MASVIPFGQPILVGHHSEGSDRRYRNRIHNTFKKGYDLQDEAERMEERLEAKEGNNSISSDNPGAIDLLRVKVGELEKLQEIMKECNKLLKKDDVSGLEKLGLSIETIEKLRLPDFAGRTGIPRYKLTNNNATIRAAKKRILELEKKRANVKQEFVFGDIRIVDNVDDNRIQVFFPDKPSEEIRSRLKRSGFRWTPSGNCWQSYRHQHSMDSAKSIATSLQSNPCGAN